MLHGCAFPGCATFTLSTYCIEHELHVRAQKESERAHGHDAEGVEPALGLLATAVTDVDADAPDTAVVS